MLKSKYPLPSILVDNVDLKYDKCLQSPRTFITESLNPENDFTDQETENKLDLARLNIEFIASYIQSSPYADPLNFLNLNELDVQTRLFALALTQFKPIRPDYATAPYMDSFNWPAVFALLRQLCARRGVEWQRQEFYLVIFRSKLLSTADRMRLGQLDKHSHEEACASGGLLTYWFGIPDSNLRNLATCIWRNREDAAAGGKGPWHRKARSAAREMYADFSFHTHHFVVETYAHSWRLEEYQ